MATEFDNLEIFFQDFGVTCVTPDLRSFQVIFDMPDQSILSDHIISAEPKIIAKSSDVATLEEGTALTIDGDAYTLKRIVRIDDGKISECFIARS